MRAFGTYVDELQSLFEDATFRPRVGDVGERVNVALDGQPGRELRRLVGLESQRATGAFFTGSVRAHQVLSSLSSTIDRRSIILDPASGAGDLLIAVTKHFEPERGFRSTASAWGRRVMGRDLHSEFVRAAKLRLGLAILSRGVPQPRRPVSVSEEFFPHIKVGCGISDPEIYSRVTHIVINPPFTMMPAPQACKWGGGSVSVAAIFLDACIEHARAGTRILAILPDVLRSGERYKTWRSNVETRARPVRIELLGQFDRWADVDVFSLELEVTRSGELYLDPWGYPPPAPKTVADYFVVAVGRVVPHRDEQVGPLYRYIHARGLPPWEVDSEPHELRRFSTEPFIPPFVVVRRTSRAGQSHRAVGTIVTGSEPVAVENHLLVLIPRESSLPKCRDLIRVLRSAQTNEWFDRRIRCRHLTAAALRQLPWWEE